MVDAISFNKDFEPHYGAAIELMPGLRRMTAPNAGPTTFRGTNTYILGRGTVAIVDPGPDNDAHVAALLDEVSEETVSHIILTHTHRDHTGALTALKKETGAETAGNGPHRPARPPRAGETARLDAAGDADFSPDITVGDGDTIAGETWCLEAIATPGHTANHLAFALDGGSALLSGDHVMGWSTTIVAPPDGAMSDYMASLDKLAARPEHRYFPGHGGPIENADAYVQALKKHRQTREAAILERLMEGDRTIEEIVAALYRDIDPRLHRAAGLSVFAHLEDLVEGGKASTDGPPMLDGRFTPVYSAAAPKP